MDRRDYSPVLMNKIIMLYGMPMSGKSFAAKKLTDYFSGKNIECEIIKTVSTRYGGKKVKFTVESIDEAIEETRIEKDGSYKKQLELAKESIKKGKLPILDATYHKFYRRVWAYKLAEQTNSELVVVWMSFDNHKEIKRLLKERRNNPDYKDKVLDSWEQYTTMVKQTDKIEDYELKNRMKIKIIKYDRISNNFEFYNCRDKGFVGEIIKALKP